MLRTTISCILFNCVLTVLAHSSITMDVSMLPIMSTNTLITSHTANATTAQSNTVIQPSQTTTGELRTTVAPTTASSEAGIKYNASMTLTNKDWNNLYLDTNSSESKVLLTKIEAQLKTLFNSSGIIVNNLTDINLSNSNGKVQAVFTMVVSPAGGDTKHKDPLLHWREAVDKGMIGSLTVDKELTKLYEVNPSGTSVGKWTTKDGECAKCNVGPVAQTRDCTGGGCSNVLTRRWVTCLQGSCSTGSILLSSLHLVIAILVLEFFA